MSTEHPRSAAVVVLAVLVAACAGSGSAGSPSPSAESSGRPSAAPTQTPGGLGAIEHPTGPTDVILRYEQAGGFVAPTFLATQAPIFTLYGDGRIVFRNPAVASPPPVGDIYRSGPFRTARLSEAQIQTALLMALGEGGLGVARPTYTDDHVADASTAVFTIDAGGLRKTVSVYALGIEVGGSADALPRAAFAKLAERLGDFDHGGTITTDAYAPDHYRGVLTEGFAGGAGVRSWPWTDIRPGDFVAPSDPNTFQLPATVLTAAQVEALGVDRYQGGLQGVTLSGPDGKTYAFALRPLLPDEAR